MLITYNHGSQVYKTDSKKSKAVARREVVQRKQEDAMRRIKLGWKL